MPTPASAGEDDPYAEETSAETQHDIRIRCILFDGAVTRTESDVYVEIVNAGQVAHDLTGWKLRDATTGRPEFTFSASALAPGSSVRVYTNEVHPESGGFSFGRGTAIWNNSTADTAELFDQSGALVSTATYDPKNPPGCEPPP